MEGLGRVFCLAFCFGVFFVSFTFAADCFAVIFSRRCSEWRRKTPKLKRTLLSIVPLPNNEPPECGGLVRIPGELYSCSRNSYRQLASQQTELSLCGWILDSLLFGPLP